MTGIKRRAIFFDRDGVLNQDIGYLYRPEDFRWVTGAPAAVAAVKALGYLAIVVTNQSGIGRGYYSEADMHRLHEFINQDLERSTGVRIDRFYFSPWHKDATLERYRHPSHPDRKPNPGMLLRAILDFGLDPSACLMIGDQHGDMMAAEAAGVKGTLFEGGDLRQVMPIR